MIKILDKSFFRQMLKLAIPIALASMLTALLNVVDSFMVTKLSPGAMGAVVLSNQIVFVFQVIIFCLAGIGMIFISQYHGNKEYHNMPYISGICLILSVSVAIVFTICTTFFSTQLLAVFGDNPTIIAEGKSFLQIVGFSSIPFAISVVLLECMRAIKRVKFPLFVAGISVLFNAFFNYIFMFGKLGLPAMGLKGAGLGTLISRLLELIIILTYIAFNKMQIIDLKKMFRAPKLIWKKYIRIVLPSLANEVFWVLAFTTYFLAYGRMEDSENILAAMNIASAIDKLLFTFLIGLGHAAGILVGNRIGEGDIKASLKTGKQATIFSMLISLVLGAMYVGLGFLSPLLYKNLTPVIENYIIQICIVYGIFTPFRAIAFTVFVGVLRAGGDTKFCAIVEALNMWLLSVPFAFIGALVLKLPIWATIAIINFLEIIKVVVVMFRLRTTKWIHMLANRPAIDANLHEPQQEPQPEQQEPQQ